jgi:hypothetical protein
MAVTQSTKSSGKMLVSGVMGATPGITDYANRHQSGNHARSGTPSPTTEWAFAQKKKAGEPRTLDDHDQQEVAVRHSAELVSCKEGMGTREHSGNQGLSQPA